MRKGLSLLEVLISLAIFLGALIAIGRLIVIGGERALEVKLESQATQLCQAKLAEVVAGAVPLEGQSNTAFDDEPGWTWSLEAETDDVPGLWRVTMRVQREERPDMRRIECSLSQLVLDPSLRGGSTTPAAPTGTEPAPADTAAQDTAAKPPTGGGGKGPPSGGGGKGPPSGGGGKGPPSKGGK